MSEPNNIPDQDDILATNERLSAENTRLTAELTTANENLAVQTKAASDATARAEDLAVQAKGLAARVATLEMAAKLAGDELARVKTENAALSAKMADFDKAVAAEVRKLGLSPKAASHKEAPATTDLTPTQRVLAAKGVGSLAELKPQSQTKTS